MKDIPLRTKQLRMMNNKLNKIFIGFVIASCCGFSACKKKMPGDVLSKSEMEDVLVDYHLAKAMADNLPPEEHYKQALYMKAVYEKYGITEEDFNSSLEWYSRHTEDLVKIYGKVEKRLLDQKNEVKELLASSGSDEQQHSATGDTVNIWSKQKVYKLTQAAATNKLCFTIYPDSNFKERDIFVWSIRCTFVSAKQHPEDAVMSLSIKYENDSVISQTRNITNSGKYTIRIQNDSPSRIREIKGFVYYNHLSQYQQDALIVDKIALTRYHVKGVPGRPVETTSNVNVVDTMKLDSANRPPVQPEVKPAADTLKKAEINSAMPRRRSINKKMSGNPNENQITPERSRK